MATKQKKPIKYTEPSGYFPKPLRPKPPAKPKKGK